MAAYEVLRSIEHNGKLYLPKSDAEAPEKAKSAGSGKDIPVDDSGFVDLDPKIAAQFDLGQIRAISIQQFAVSEPEGKKQKAEGGKQKK